MKNVKNLMLIAGIVVGVNCALNGLPSEDDSQESFWVQIANRCDLPDVEVSNFMNSMDGAKRSEVRDFCTPNKDGKFPYEIALQRHVQICSVPCIYRALQLLQAQKMQLIQQMEQSHSPEETETLSNRIAALQLVEQELAQGHK